MTAPSSIQGAIPWRTCGQCIHRQYLRSNLPRAQNRFLSTTRTLCSAAKNPLRSPGNARAREQEIAKYRRSMTLSAAGIAACAVAMYGVIKLDLFGLEPSDGKTEQAEEGPDSKANNGKMKLEGPGGFPSSPSLIHIQGQDGVDQVATGTSSVPHFPSTIRLPKSLDDGPIKSGDELPSGPGVEEEEYQLLGLGIRTVSFLQIQVYVVGLYVAKSDLAELQQRLIRTAVNPPGEGQVISNAVGATSATSLVSTERQGLKQLLLDPERGDEAWDAILKKDGLRTVFRIVPTRNTDFLHLRDGWVRGITARAQKANAKAKESGATTPGEFQDESFGSSLNDFKAVFGQRNSVPKGQTLLLARNSHGQLDVLLHTDPSKPVRVLGRVSDERISRLVWLNYLAGKTVSSEGARQSVVDGVMGIVERPAGTVLQKVV